MVWQLQILKHTKLEYQYKGVLFTWQCNTRIHWHTCALCITPTQSAISSYVPWYQQAKKKRGTLKRRKSFANGNFKVSLFFWAVVGVILFNANNLIYWMCHNALQVNLCSVRWDSVLNIARIGCVAIVKYVVSGRKETNWFVFSLNGQRKQTIKHYLHAQREKEIDQVIECHNL